MPDRRRCKGRVGHVLVANSNHEFVTDGAHSPMLTVLLLFSGLRQRPWLTQQQSLPSMFETQMVAYSITLMLGVVLPAFLRSRNLHFVSLKETKTHNID